MFTRGVSVVIDHLHFMYVTVTKALFSLIV